MYDINKILEKFAADLQAKTIEEKVRWLQSYGFQVSAKEIEAVDNFQETSSQHRGES